MNTPDSEAIRAALAEHLADPEWVAHLNKSLGQMYAGQVLPWRVALLPLPRPVFWVLFHWIAPWTWGRRVRRLPKATVTQTSKPD